MTSVFLSDTVKDAKYYLIHPKDSYIVYLMTNKPDYTCSPFYKDVENEEYVDDYLDTRSESSYDMSDISPEMEESLKAMDLLPEENEVKYLFGAQQNFSEKDLLSLLGSLSYSADEVVADHYKIHTWHIEDLLKLSPFKEYIQKHYPNIPKSTIAPPQKSFEEMIQKRKESYQKKVNELNKKRLLL